MNFKAAGRLARVPLWSRVFGSVLDVSLLARGAVPGGFTAAAQIEYAEGLKVDPRRVYHGRVVRDGGWIVLQYLFFFYMNDWRSSFAGVNDHESDWEQIFVFLYENANGELEPRWVAYASHDFKGDDLRRRWDDPLLVKQDSHPVVFAGAGSHASYYEQGEYMVGMTPDFIKPVERVLQQASKFYYQRFSEADDHTRATPEGTRPFLSIPNIDYARGDGLRIGPGQTEEWTPLIISDEVGWVDRYRGLWGLDTRDPVGGERAPSGPKYNRDGSVRQSWYDPLGWAGLDKTLPPIDVPGELDARLNCVEAERHTLEGEIQVKRAALRDLALDVEALRETGYLSASLKKQEKQLEVDQKELQGSGGEAQRCRRGAQGADRLSSAHRARRSGQPHGAYSSQPSSRTFAVVAVPGGGSVGGHQRRADRAGAVGGVSLAPAALDLADGRRGLVHGRRGSGDGAASHQVSGDRHRLSGLCYQRDSDLAI